MVFITFYSYLSYNRLIIDGEMFIILIHVTCIRFVVEINQNPVIFLAAHLNRLILIDRFINIIQKHYTDSTTSPIKIKNQNQNQNKTKHMRDKNIV